MNLKINTFSVKVESLCDKKLFLPLMTNKARKYLKLSRNRPAPFPLSKQVPWNVLDRNVTGQSLSIQN